MQTTQLFHLIADAACGRVRRRIVELGVESVVSFRNVHFDQARADFAQLGGEAVPANEPPNIGRSLPVTGR